MAYAVFISLVGMQVMAVLNPLLSIVKDEKTTSVVLIPTATDIDSMKSLLSTFIQKRGQLKNHEGNHSKTRP